MAICVYSLIRYPCKLKEGLLFSIYNKKYHGVPVELKLLLLYERNSRILISSDLGVHSIYCVCVGASLLGIVAGPSSLELLL